MEEVPNQTSVESKIEQITAEIERVRLFGNAKLDELNTEKEFWISISQNSTLQVVNAQFAKLKNVWSKSKSIHETDFKNQISQIQYSISELKKAVSIQDSENAQLLSENIILKSEYEKYLQKHEQIIQQKAKYRQAFERGASRIIQNKIVSHQRLISELQALSNHIEKATRKSKNVENQLESMRRTITGQNTQIQYMDSVFEKLLNAIIEISEVPKFEKHTPREMINDPQILIQIVDQAEENARRRKNQTDRELAASSRSYVDSISSIRKSPLSKRVAQLLNKAGNQVINLSKEIEENSNSDDDSFIFSE